MASGAAFPNRNAGLARSFRTASGDLNCKRCALRPQLLDRCREIDGTNEHTSAAVRDGDIAGPASVAGVEERDARQAGCRGVREALVHVVAMRQSSWAELVLAVAREYASRAVPERQVGTQRVKPVFVKINAASVVLKIEAFCAKLICQSSVHEPLKDRVHIDQE